MKTEKFKVFDTTGKTLVGEFTKEDIDAAIKNGAVIAEEYDSKSKERIYKLGENSMISYPVTDETGKPVGGCTIPQGEADPDLKANIVDGKIAGFIQTKTDANEPETKTVVTHTIKFSIDTFITVETGDTDRTLAVMKAVEKFKEIIDPAKYARYDSNKIDIVKII